MGAVTTDFRLGFILKEGPANIRYFKERSTTETFQRGSPVKLNADGNLEDMLNEMTTGSTASSEDGYIGIAAKNKTGVTGSLIPVYVLSQEQIWEVHSAKASKPNTASEYDPGDICKLQYSASDTYTFSDGNGTTHKTPAAVWFVKHTAATATKGVIIMGHRRGEEGTKGGRLLVSFNSVSAASRYK